MRFLVGRLLQAFLTLLIMVTVVFFAGRATGDPVNLLLPLAASVEQRAVVTAELGLDQPLFEQYRLYLSHVAQGDFGTSVRYGVPVRRLIAQRLPNSLSLALVSVAASLLLAVPMGVLAATYEGRVPDRVLQSFALLGQSVPPFWLGIVLILIFTVELPLLPTGGADSPQSYVLPVVTLSLFLWAGILRLTRSSVLEVLQSQYVKFARLRGLPEWRVIWIHALRNALATPITFAAIYLGLFVGAAVVVETIFSWPGVGRLAFDAIQTRDFPVMQGVAMLGAAAVIVSNLLADLALLALDPRISK